MRGQDRAAGPPSSALLSAIVESSDDAIVSKTLDGIITSWNPGAQRIFGYTAEEILGKPISTIIPDDRLHEENYILSQLRQGRRIEHYETVRKTRDGRLVDISVSISPIRDGRGRIIGASKIARDITSRNRSMKELEEARSRRDTALLELRETEARFHAVVQATPECVTIISCEGDILYANPIGIELLRGTRPSEIIGRRMADFIFPADRSGWEEHHGKVCRGEAITWKYRMALGDEDVRWMESHAVPLVLSNGGVGHLAVTRDITEGRRAQEALSAEKIILEKIAMGTPRDLVLEELLLGIERQSSDGMKCSILITDPSGTSLLHGAAPSLPKEYNEAIHGLKVGPGIGSCGASVYERKLVCASDITTHPYWTNFRELAQKFGLEACCSNPIFSREGTILGTVAMYYSKKHSPNAHDLELVRSAGHLASIVIERDRTEERLEHAFNSERAARAEAEHANRMKDEFLATLSHELRTPLNAIVGWCQVLKRPGSKDRLEEGLDIIARNGRAQAQMIEDLLDLSRVTAGKVRLEIQPVDLRELLSLTIETMKPLASTKDLKVSLSVSGPSYSVPGDPNRLQQIFSNLLTNAIKFSRPGGSIEAELSASPSQVEIRIRDFGEGIERAILPFIFERFRQGDPTTTRRHGGLGLGLAIVKQLVDMHGGTVRAESDGPNTGATFLVTLPVHAKSTIDETRRTGESNAGLPDYHTIKLTGLKVLVLDDEPDARALAKNLLEDCEATVMVAGSVEKACEYLSEFRPDVVVSDLAMPGEDGYAFVRRLRTAQDGKHIPAIALTAYAGSEDRARAIEAGFDLHLAKPFAPGDLVSAIQGLAASHAS